MPKTVAACAVLSLGVLVLSGCQAHSSDVSKSPTVLPAPSAPKPVGTGGPKFDGDRAFAILKDQCAFGPRVPNTDPHEKCLAYIKSALAPNVDKVETQTFKYRDTSRHQLLNLTNVIGVINPDAPRKIMLLTHWDTRPTADNELDAADKAKPILGADDAASGTAVLIELAKVFHEQKPAVGVVFLFVDGEDWGPGDDRMYLGAKYFAKNPGTYKPEYAILLDMIGDDLLDVYREETSENLHRDLNDKVWNAAAALGYSAEFPDKVKYRIGDDHDAMNAGGIPTIDLIDFDYAYWHTLGDTPEHCSAKSLQVTGDVMEKVIYDEK